MNSRSDGYYWLRHHDDGSTFIALLEDGAWWIPGVEESVEDIEVNATLIGAVPRRTVDGESVDN